MPLESGTYIDDLVAANPVGATDTIKFGDDHIRLLKSTLQATFPNMGGAAWRVQAKSSGYTVLAADQMTVLNCTAGLTLALTAAATLANGHMFVVIANGGDVVIDPDSAETVDGAATLTVYDGATATVFCTGTEFLTVSRGPSSIVPQVVAEAGTNTVGYIWTAERVKQAIAALVVSGRTVVEKADTDSPYSAASNDLVACDVSAGVLVIVLPATGNLDIADVSNNAFGFNIEVQPPSGEQIMGGGADVSFFININNFSGTFYRLSTGDWRVSE